MEKKEDMSNEDFNINLHQVDILLKALRRIGFKNIKV